jgi:hypothetical protein
VHSCRSSALLLLASVILSILVRRFCITDRQSCSCNTRGGSRSNACFRFGILEQFRNLEPGFERRLGCFVHASAVSNNKKQSPPLKETKINLAQTREAHHAQVIVGCPSASERPPDHQHIHRPCNIGFVDIRHISSTPNLLGLTRVALDSLSSNGFLPV